ncbi:MAG TPA: hypothetical protein VJT67_16635 [Longimicrobiaceae bacterium]|nr:hypothetical protein [Longimicrobiaceae bacterium]
MRVPRIHGTAALPAFVFAVIPKCPVCLMLLFGTLGLGHPLHDRVFGALQAALLTAAVALLVARRRSTLPLLFGLSLAEAAAVLLRLLGVVPPWVAWVGAGALAATWLVSWLRRAEACGCAPRAEAAAG